MFLKSFLKNILSTNFILPIKKGIRLILIYHDISNTDSRHFSTELSTPVSLFEKHLDFLTQNFEIISLDQIVSEKLPSNNNYCSITFDDGFYSVYKNAYPLLKKRKIPFTLSLNGSAVQNNFLWTTDIIAFSKNIQYLKYVFNNNTSNFKQFFIEEQFLLNPFECLMRTDFSFDIEKLNYNKFSGDTITEPVYMNEEHIKLLAKDENITIGNHTFSHFNMSNISLEKIHNEIERNQLFLEKLTDRKINHFAIPFGKKNHYNDTVLKAASQSNAFIYSSNSAVFNEKQVNSGMKLFPRIGITNQKNSEIHFFINRTFFNRIDV